MSGRRGLSIRGVAAADAPLLAEMLAASGHAVAPVLLAARLAAIAAGPGIALAAWEWGPPSGLVVLHWYRTLQDARPVAQIDLLLVAPADRRRGLGRMLLKAGSQAARAAGCGDIGLVTAQADGETMSFCQATGFAADGLWFTRALRKA